MLGKKSRLIIYLLIGSIVAFPNTIAFADDLTKEAQNNNILQNGEWQYEKSEKGIVLKKYIDTNLYPEIPDSIKGEKVVEIGSGCFSEKTDIVKVLGGGNISQIDESAFENCSKLQSVPINDNITSIGDKAFKNCSALEGITLSKELKNIGSSAFEGCKLFDKISIPEKLESIGDNAFANCENLDSLEIPDSVSSVGSNIISGTDLAKNNYEFTDSTDTQNHKQTKSISKYKGNDKNCWISVCDGDYTNESNLVSLIGDKAFYNNSSIINLHVGNSTDKILTNLGAYAFSECSSLQKVTFESNVNMISEGCFENCSKLTDVVFNNSVKEIGNNAFCDCINLPHDFHISKNITSIGVKAFSNTGITTAYIESPETYISSNSFDENTKLTCNGISYIFVNDNLKVVSVSKDAVNSEGKITIPNSIFGHNVSVIGNKSFNSIDNVLTIEVPNNIQNIEDFAFINCTSLNNVIFDSNNLINISKNAFSSCDNLKYVNSPDFIYKFIYDENKIICGIEIVKYIGSISEISNMETVNGFTVIGIGNEAFKDNKNIKSIVLPETVKYIGIDAFSGCDNMVSNIYDNFLYYNFKNSVLIVGYQGNDEKIVINRKLNDIKVLGIGQNAFAGKTFIKSLEVSDGVTSISSGAFLGCTNLCEYDRKISPTVKYISDSAFENFKTENDGKYAYEYLNAEKTKAKIVSYLVKSEKNLIIPQKLGNADVISISNNAFQGHPEIETVTLPSTIKNIGNDAFQGTAMVNKYYNNFMYTVVDNMAVINGYIGDQSDITIPDTVDNVPVNRIGDNAFSGNTVIRSVKFSSGISTIGNNAFYRCLNLEKIDVSQSLSNIGENAFLQTKVSNLKLPSNTVYQKNSFNPNTVINDAGIDKEQGDGKTKQSENNQNPKEGEKSKGIILMLFVSSIFVIKKNVKSIFKKC